VTITIRADGRTDLLRKGRPSYGRIRCCPVPGLRGRAAPNDMLGGLKAGQIVTTGRPLVRAVVGDAAGRPRIEVLFGNETRLSLDLNGNKSRKGPPD